MFSATAYAQQAIEPDMYDVVAPYVVDQGLFQTFMNNMPSWGLSLIVALIALMAVCRVASEVLLLIAHRTKTTIDDSALSFLSLVLGWGARALALIGIGMPKSLILEKAQKLQGKEHPYDKADPQTLGDS